MIWKHKKSKHSSKQEKIFAGLSSSSEAKKQNRRIHHIHKLPPSQKLKQRIHTTLNRLFRANKCNNTILTIIYINETLTQNIPTILVKHNLSKKTTESPSQFPNLPSKKLRQPKLRLNSFQEDDSTEYHPHSKTVTSEHHT